jgi:poly(A) polymerase
MGNFERVEAKMQDVNERDSLKGFQSPVRGKEIMAECGLKEGRVVGLIKKAIEDAILDEKIDNTYEDAFAYFMEIKDNIISDNTNDLPNASGGL